MQCIQWKTNDDGYITVAGAGVSAALISLFIAIAWQAGSVVAREQAQIAADLSAVAGAYSFARGDPPDTACAVAEQVAELNNSTLLTCTFHGEDLIVSVNVRGKEAHAKAGPL